MDAVPLGDTVNPGNTLNTGNTLHPGEEAVRERAGSPRRDIGSGSVGSTVPAVARDFLDGARLAALAVVDERGAVFADVLGGDPGLLRAPDERTVVIGAAPPLTAPLFAAGVSRTVGLIALEPWTRRRMRVNGTAVRRGGSLLLRTEQVYSNCPKYIQDRSVDAGPPAPARSWDSPAGASYTEALTGRQRELIGRADTFFVATHAAGHGADMSHRGGNPGFVTVADARRLSWPDYVGNSMYMTLGNLLHEPRCALVFPDWESGKTLHLRGRARTDWDPGRAASVPGALRIVDFDIESVAEVADGMPLRWRFGSYHRFNPPVAGSPSPAADGNAAGAASMGG